MGEMSDAVLKIDGASGRKVGFAWLLLLCVFTGSAWSAAPAASLGPDVETLASIAALAAHDRVCSLVAERAPLLTQDEYRDCIRKQPARTYCAVTANDLRDLRDLMQVDPWLAARGNIDGVDSYIAVECGRGLAFTHTYVAKAKQACMTYMPILEARRIQKMIRHDLTDDSIRAAQACGGNHGLMVLDDECRAASRNIRRQRINADQLPRYFRYFCPSLFNKP